MIEDAVAESWLEKVQQDHVELKSQLQDLRLFLEQPRPEIGRQGSHTWAAGLSQRLVRLHDRLFRHFRFEEEEGMKTELIERHPRATTRIEKVLGEHPRMLEEIRRLMSDAMTYSEGRAPAEANLRRRVLDLLDQLDQHEREETDLIQRLEYRDTGAAD